MGVRPSEDDLNANKTKLERAETAPKVLLYDVECSPMLGMTWGPRWESNLIEVLEEKMIISFAWKWLGESQVRCLALPDFKLYSRNRRDNRALIKRLHQLISSADVVIAHNVDNFDDKMANTDFIINGFEPSPPHKTVDTLKVARRKFKFSSNRLGDLGTLLRLGKKVKHPGWEMWKGCLEGDPKSWANMKLYNLGDVVLLEKIYLKMRPWMVDHPVMMVRDGDFGCPTCLSKRYQARGTSLFSGGYRHRFRCLNAECKRWFRGSVVKSKWKFK